MKEPEGRRSLEERKAASPIHQMVDVDGYLSETSVPHHLHRPFHEIILARGEFPIDTSREQREKFAKKVMDISTGYNMLIIEVLGLKGMYDQFLTVWRRKLFQNR